MNKPFLATTALEEFWDMNRPMLFLGEWCRLYARRQVWRILGDHVLSPSWSDQEESEQARSYIEALYEEMLPRLGLALDGVHGVPHVPRYWRIIVGPWLFMYLSATYERYRSLRRALEAEPELTTIGLDSSCFVTPGNTLEFAEWVKDDVYNLQVYTRIWQAMGLKFPVKVLTSGRMPNSARSGGASQGLIVRLLRSMLGGPGKLVFCNSYFPKRILLQILFRTLGKATPVQPLRFTPSGGRINHDARRCLAAALPNRDPFEAVVVELFANDLPKCFLEDYGEIGEASRTYYPSSPKAIVSATWAYDEPFKRWVAESQECGAKLLGSQHGGDYGLLKYIPREDLELAIVDRYYSWGWMSDRFPKKTVPMPAGLMSGRIQLAADNRKRGILWVSTQWSRYPLWLLDSRFPEYLAWQARFLSVFPARLRDELRLRPHREDGGWDIVQRLRDVGLGLQTEDWSRPFDQSLAECRLYVCDHLSTTFVEALAVGKPTILFWSPEANVLRHSAVDCVAQLKSAGILFDKPEEAAAAVDAAYDDVERWWNDPLRQDARERFCASYARTSATAHAEWTRELSGVLNRKN